MVTGNFVHPGANRKNTQGVNVHAENTFADSAKIRDYARDAVKQMQMAGILAGKSGNVFDPQGTATCAEASAALHRFVELAVTVAKFSV